MSRSTSPLMGRNEFRRRLRSAAFALLVMTAIGGCGGSSDDESASDPSATDGAGSDDSGADSGGEGGAGNYAKVTIGSMAFEVPPDGLNLCNSLENLVFGSFAAGVDGSAVQAGGTDAAVQINFGVPVTNWEEEGLQPPTVNVDLLGDGIRWFASVDRGLGSVDSWELSDGIATGQATFEAEEAGSGTVVGTEAGSFEIVCR